MGSQWPAGVVPRNRSIEIRLTYNDKRHYISLSWSPTLANIKRAGKLRQEAMDAIKWGVFRWQDFFPDSKYAQQDSGMKTFGEYASLYLRTLTCAANSKEKYQESLDRCFLPSLSDRLVNAIRYSELLELIAKFNWQTNKTRNNNLIPLRGVFKLAFRDGAINKNPCDGIINGKHQYPEADPLIVEEMELFLNWLKKTQDPQWVNYFEFAFFTGLRPSEQIALSWDSIDFNRGYARVERSKIKGVLRSHTKTYRVRDIEFNKRAKEALLRQKAWTFLRGEEVFMHPSTGKPFPYNASVRLMWTRGLKACGLRHRNSYQTRHTFCTNCLQSGAKIHWVSQQLGHASAMMTLNRYSKWVQQANSENESAKLDAFVAAQQPMGSSKGAKVGF